MSNKYNPEQHHRRSIRLRGYDYSQAGAYFVTLCTCQKQYLFGEMVSEQMHLSDCGQIAQEEWLRSLDIRTEIELDEWVIMPNHIHGIIVIADVGANDSTAPVGAHGRAPSTDMPSANTPSADAAPIQKLQRKPRSLSSFVAGFKAATTKRVNALRDTPGEPVWQDNYYEHIIRNEIELDRVREYIIYNPAKWANDKLNAVNW